MSTLSDLQMYGRFVFGLPWFLRRRITLEEARAVVRRGLAEREENFLRLVRRAVFGNPESPYLPLLRHAQCELGDLESSVRSMGLEPTLRELRKAGVYFSFEEYKGRQPVVRDGQVIPLQPQAFSNPLAVSAYATETGGTASGITSRVNTDLDNLWSTVPHLMLVRQIHGALDVPFAIWRGPLPDPTGVGNILRAVAYGGTPVRWFSPVPADDFRPAFKNRVANAYIVWMTRLVGGGCPAPEAVPLERADVVARWAADSAASHGGAFISASVSLSVRVCVAAFEMDLDLSGVVFLAGGEPATAARKAAIERSGAHMAPVYISSDMGPIGHGCGAPAHVDDQHLLEDCVALVQHPREVLRQGSTVDAFYFTSLRPAAATILINVESDDYGVVEERSCGCPFGELGYHRHLHTIRSYGKLTGEGVTLVNSDMVRILEEVLPATFGGSPLDYQLVEEEGSHGLGRLVLRVSPELPLPSTQRVIDTILEALGKSGEAADMARVFWKQADTLCVRREPPEWTARGKLRFLKTSSGGAVGEREEAVTTIRGGDDGDRKVSA